MYFLLLEQIDFSGDDNVNVSRKRMSYSVSCNQETIKVARVQGLERNNGPKIAVPFKKTGEQCK